MRREDVVKICDLTGDQASEDAPVETVEFSLDRAAYEIDLREDQAEQFRDWFRRYVEAGRKQPPKVATVAPPARGEATRKRKQNAEFLQEVRAWARGRGHSVSDHRVAQGLIDAYKREKAEQAAPAEQQQPADDMRIPAFMAPAV